MRGSERENEPRIGGEGRRGKAVENAEEDVCYIFVCIYKELTHVANIRQYTNRKILRVTETNRIITLYSSI